ncbi:MAG TPA: molecular chaperone, partial [Sphingomicrobium sp.]|nr:molecular chaperone [Sphingomicrobium sp.]
MGIAEMLIRTKFMLGVCLVAAPFVAYPSAASAGVGDLLVAPTRLVLDGRRGAEIILNNIGEEPATYRVSVEFRRMTENGDLIDVTTPTDADKKAEDMIVFAPRKVMLAPHEPQAIRIAARPAPGLPDGEYRVHMLFRAIPPSSPVVQSSGEQPKGVQFKLTPVYGVT